MAQGLRRRCERLVAVSIEKEIQCAFAQVIESSKRAAPVVSFAGWPPPNDDDGGGKTGGPDEQSSQVVN